MASALKAAGEVIDEALGIKSNSKKSVKKAVFASDNFPDGAADGAGAHGAAGGVVPLHPEQMVPVESLIKARRLVFGKDFPATPPTKISKQELWEIISVLRTFSKEGKPLTEVDPPKDTDSSGAAVAAAARGGADSGDSAGTAEDAAGGGADVGGTGAGAADVGAGAAGAGAAGAGAGAAGAVAAASGSGAAAAGTAGAGAAGAGAGSDADESGDWNVVPGKPCVMRPRYCRSWLGGVGCSRPEKCKFLHPPFCKRKSCRKGKSDDCPNFHRLSRHADVQKPGNAAAGPSNRAKASPPAPNKKPPSMDEKNTQLNDRMSEVERNIARLDGISWALAAAPKPPPVPMGSPTPPASPALLATPAPPPSSPKPAAAPSALVPQSDLVLQVVSGMAELVNKLQAALTAGTLTTSA